MTLLRNEGPTYMWPNKHAIMMIELPAAKETWDEPTLLLSVRTFLAYCTVLYCFSEALQRRVPRAWPNIVLFIGHDTIFILVIMMHLASRQRLESTAQGDLLMHPALTVTV